MRLQRELMTIPVGQSVSNPINLGSEKLVGIRTINKSDVVAIRIQCMVEGSIDGPVAEQVWVDVRVTTNDTPEGNPFSPDFLAVSLPNGASVILFPRNICAYPLPVIRIGNQVAGVLTNVTGTDYTGRVITDPHS